MPRGIGCMNDAPMTVAAFTGQVVVGVLIPRKIDTGIDQPVDAFPAMFDREPHGVLMAQAGAGIEGVGDVVFGGILIIQNCGDTALCPERGATADLGLAHHADLQVLWQIERDGKAGSTTADNENIVFEGLWHRVVIAGHNVDVY